MAKISQQKNPKEKKIISRDISSKRPKEDVSKDVLPKRLKKERITTTKTGPGRPPKNIIGGNKAKTGPGRPPKNIILTRKSKIEKIATEKKVLQENRQKIEFHSSQLKGSKRNNTFAFTLLIFSFLLFVFSIYKAFFNNDLPNPLTIIDTPPKQSLTGYLAEDFVRNNTSETGVQTPPVVTIEPYQDTNTIQSGNISTGQLPSTTGAITKNSYEIPRITFDQSFGRGQQGEQVTILQKFLSNEGLYSGAISGIYDQNTVNAVYLFQIQHKIVDQKTAATLRGYFGPGTRKVINNMIK